MRLLVVYCHPVPTSFTASVRDAALRALRSGGHEIRLTDLYAEGFDPVLSRLERERYLIDPAANAAELPTHVDDLGWAEGLIFIFPTWYYGPPAMLKGWLERVWLPGLVFEPAQRKGQRTVAKMQHVRLVAVITSSGSPWWWLKVMGDPVWALFGRGLRILFNRRCETIRLQLYNMNVVSEAERAAFLVKVERRLARITA